MTDDISKVVREMRYSATNWKCGSGVSAVVAAEQAVDWATRLESATTPAEVDVRRYEVDVVGDIGGPRFEMTPHATGDWVAYDDYAALAHQLALVTESRDMAKGIIDALAAEMKAAGVALIDYKVINTRADDLARQLAEAKVDTAKWKSLSDAAQIGINVQHKREVRLQSQLAEATRRLGEVEEALRQISSDNHAGLRVQQVAQAALTKEPAK